MKRNILTTIAALSLAACSSSHAQEPPAKPTPSSTQAGPSTQGHAHHGHHGGDMRGSGGMKHGDHEGMPCSMADNCPMKLPGVVVRADDIAGGATLTFTTSGDVSALRERVRKMAEMHAQGCHSDRPSASPSPAKPAPKATPKAPTP